MFSIHCLFWISWCQRPFDGGSDQLARAIYRATSWSISVASRPNQELYVTHLSLSLSLSPYACVCGDWNVTVCLYCYRPPFYLQLGSVLAAFDAAVSERIVPVAFVRFCMCTNYVGFYMSWQVVFDVFLILIRMSAFESSIYWTPSNPPPRHLSTI